MLRRATTSTLWRGFASAVSPVSRARLDNYGQPMHHTHPHHIPGPDHVSPYFTKAAHASRRDRLMKVAAHETATSLAFLQFSAGSHVTMTNDIPYRWRQQSDFLYLTGFEEGDSALLMTSAAGGKRQDVLFVRPRDAARELWDGSRTGVERVPAGFGLAGASVDTLQQRVLKVAEACDAVLVGPVSPSHPTAGKIVDAVRVAHPQKLRTSVVPELLRLTKDAAERDLMQAAALITARAFASVMRQCEPGMRESVLDALLEYESVRQGATRLAYPPVVAGGVSANTLHYIANNHVLQDGELVLIDAGCELQSYASDVTRTIPVNGVFSDAQTELYNAVLTANVHCIDMCRASGNVSLQTLNRAAVNILGQELVRLGFASSVEELHSSGRLRTYFPHSIGHYLGMDVHDTHALPTDLALVDGVVVTIEPGLYIPHDDVRAPERFRGIGIRIEDNVLITKQRPVVLTCDIPKTVGAIEEAMRRT